MVHDAVVLGAGINGLATAYHLALRGLRVNVLEQYQEGHSHGSSHGFSRITRSTYSSPKYVEIIQIAHREDWPQLSQEAGQTLLHPCPGCFFGPGLDPYQASLEAVPEVLPLIEILDLASARQRFPHFSFSDSERVIWDKTCALVAAQATLQTLRTGIVKRRGTIQSELRVQDIELGAGPLRLHTSRGPILTERLVIAAGSWLGSLLPDLRSKLRPAHQDVGYFKFNQGGENGDQFPVWIYAGKQGLAGDDTFYGLPEFGRPGVKVARHRTGGHVDSPRQQLPAAMPAEALADLHSFARAQFAFPAQLCGYEPCMYTNTANEDFLIDYHPHDRRVLIVSACSGHGFKFGPLTGRIAAGLLLDGESDVEPFERYRADFSLAQIPDWIS